MRLKASLLVGLLLMTYFTTLSSAQVPPLSADPQITVDCDRTDSREYISYSSGGGSVDCSINNEESKNLKVKISWTGNFETTSYAYNNDDSFSIKNGDDILIKSDEQINAGFYIRVGKIEPSNEDFKLEIVVTESEEFNGWQECEDCESHEFETTYKIGPWAQITNAQLVESTIPGIPVGLFANGPAQDISLECTEDLLSETSINVEFEIDSSSAGRDSMYIDLWFELHLLSYTIHGVPIDGDLDETTNTMKMNLEGNTSIKASLNLDSFENRSEEQWYISLRIKGNIYLDQYENLEPDSIIESSYLWSYRCELNSSVMDPDLASLDDELQMVKVPSMNTGFLILTILCAVMRRNYSKY